MLPDGEHIFRLGDAGAGDVADVQKTVQARLDFDECAVRHESADRAGDGIAGLERGAAAGECATGLLFENDAAIDDHVFVGDVELGDAAGDLLADEGFELGGVARAAAAGGHEGADADVNAEAAFDDRADGAGDGKFLGERRFEGGPVAGLRDAEARELVVALLVAACDGDGKCVAGLDLLRVVREGRARQHAFHFVADVENDLIGGERDDRALQLADFALFGFGRVSVRAIEGGERVGKGLCGLWLDIRLTVQASILNGSAGSRLSLRIVLVAHCRHSSIVSRCGGRRKSVASARVRGGGRCDCARRGCAGRRE